nr:MAG TPA: hypothetical protein [Caudoviricetes sp.]
MDVKTIIEIVQNLGVPVACLIFCGWFIVRQENRHESEVSTLSDTIKGNTEAISEIKTMIQTFMDYMAKMNTGGDN